MKLINFTNNEIAFYHSIAVGDNITVELTHESSNTTKIVTPVVSSVQSNFFVASINCVTGSTSEDLPEGDIYLQFGGGYYHYNLKNGATLLESSQIIVISPDIVQTITGEGETTTVITNPYSGSSGSSGLSGTNGITGLSGTNGESGSSGSSGEMGSTGSSGVSGTSGESGSSGSGGESGSSGTSVQLNYIGLWTAASYNPNTVAVSTINGNTYISTVVILNVYTDPANDPTEWELFAYAGMDGTSGESGSNGSSGESGSSGTSGAQSTEVDILGTRLGGLAGATANVTTLMNLKRNLFGRVPQTGNRMFLSDSGSPGTLTAFIVDPTYGTLQFSWMPFIGGISGNKINTILPYKSSTVTATTKFRIMFYQASDSTLFSSLNAFYGTYVPDNYSQSGYPAVNTYVNNLSSTVSYSAANCTASTYFPLPQTLLGYSAIITIEAGSGNQTIGHTQMYAPDGSNGFYLPDGNIVMAVEMESTNATVGTFGRLQKTPSVIGINALNCSPSWTNSNTIYYGINFNKSHCLNGGAFKTVAQGGMESYLPPSTITIAELAAMFGGPGALYSTLSNWAALHTMVTFA